MNDLVTIDELEAAGLTVADVQRRCPWAVERIGLDGRPCWAREELTPLLDDVEDPTS